MASAAVPTLRAEGLQVCLQQRPVLQDINLNVSTGWTCIVGPNGAGKSTLLRALAGLQPCHQGTVWLGDRRLQDWSSRSRAQTLAWLAQQSEVAGELTVRDVVMLGRLPHLGLLGRPGPLDEAVVEQAMVTTECAAWQHRRLSDLSGGERQRALLARALAVQAPVLLLDEPTAHLDPPHQVALVQHMRHLGHTQVVVSVLHELSLALAADRLVVMAAGGVHAIGAPADPVVQATLERVFEGAIHITAVAGQWVALPRWTV